MLVVLGLPGRVWEQVINRFYGIFPLPVVVWHVW